MPPFITWIFRIFPEIVRKTCIVYGSFWQCTVFSTKCYWTPVYQYTRPSESSEGIVVHKFIQESRYSRGRHRWWTWRIWCHCIKSPNCISNSTCWTSWLILILSPPWWYFVFSFMITWSSKLFQRFLGVFFLFWKNPHIFSYFNLKNASWLFWRSKM